MWGAALPSPELAGVSGLTADSRAVQPGFLFAGLPGGKGDGRGFIAEAVARGAMAFFSENYGETVRVVEVPAVSLELCGGNHVARTSEIGSFLVVAEQSVGAG